MWRGQGWVTSEDPFLCPRGPPLHLWDTHRPLESECDLGAEATSFPHIDREYIPGLDNRELSKVMTLYPLPGKLIC